MFNSSQQKGRVYCFAKAGVCFLSLFIGLPGTSVAAESIFGQGYEWKGDARGEGTISNTSTITAKDQPGIAIDFDFQSVPAEEKSVWAGASASDLLIPEGSETLSFRVASDEGCLMKFTIKDSAGVGYDLVLPVSSGGGWEDHEIPLEISSFTTRWGKVVSEMPEQVTFPLVYVGFSVMRSPDYPSQGSLKISDVPKTTSKK
jgi:hypothetical protein